MCFTQNRLKTDQVKQLLDPLWGHSHTTVDFPDLFCSEQPKLMIKSRKGGRPIFVDIYVENVQSYIIHHALYLQGKQGMQSKGKR
jgi:hypothetical protein